MPLCVWGKAATVNSYHPLKQPRWKRLRNFVSSTTLLLLAVCVLVSPDQSAVGEQWLSLQKPTAKYLRLRPTAKRAARLRNQLGLACRRSLSFCNLLMYMFEADHRGRVCNSPAVRFALQTVEQAFRQIQNIVDFSSNIMSSLLGDKFVHSGVSALVPRSANSGSRAFWCQKKYQEKKKLNIAAFWILL